MTFRLEDEDHQRKGVDRKELIKILTEWRQKTHDDHTIGFIYDIQDIVTEDEIGLVTKISPSRLHRDGPDAITMELREMVEWGSGYAKEMFQLVWRYENRDSDSLTYGQL